MKTTATATTGNKKNTKKAASAATEKKNSRTNVGRVQNHKTQQAEARRKAAAAEAEELKRQREQLEREQQIAQAAEEKKAAKETAATIRGKFKGAREEVKQTFATPLGCFHALNKLAKSGKVEGSDVMKLTDLLWTYELLSDLTPTANARKGYSYDVVKVNTAGQVCKLVKYTATPEDERESNPAGAILITTRNDTRVELCQLDAGSYLMIPVKITPAGMLDAAKSYVETYTDAFNDLRSETVKKVNAARDARKAENAAKKAAAAALAALKKAEQAQKEAAADIQQAEQAAAEQPAAIEIQLAELDAARRAVTAALAAQAEQTQQDSAAEQPAAGSFFTKLRKLAAIF